MEVLWTRDEGARREETLLEPSNSRLLAYGSVSREGEKQPQRSKPFVPGGWNYQGRLERVRKGNVGPEGFQASGKDVRPSAHRLWLPTPNSRLPTRDNSAGDCRVTPPSQGTAQGCFFGFRFVFFPSPTNGWR